MKKIIIGIVLFVAVFCFIFFSHMEFKRPYTDNTESNDTRTEILDYNDSNTSCLTEDKDDDFDKNLITIEETKHYKIYQLNSLYYCNFYDNNNVVVKTEGPMRKEPKITTISANFIRFTMQAGTGIGTRWGYYFNTENMLFSEIFHGLCDQTDDKVACVQSDKVIVSNIWDKSKYYKEFSSFLYSFSDVAFPIINVEFSKEGDSINITYLFSSEYREITETFYL